MDTSNVTDEKHEETSLTDKKREEPTNEIYEDVGKPAYDGDVTHEWATKFENLDEDLRKQMSRKLLSKIDIHLLPFLIIMYMLNYLDRSNLAQARQGTLEKDLHMKGTDYNIATSILFVGYLLMQLPSNLLITRMRPSLYLGTVMTVWGVVSTCNSAVHSFHSLIAVRFVLGFVEAPFFPGAVFLMSSWYTRAELTRRISWLYAGNALAQMFGGLISAGILGHLNGNRGIAAWRWLFIIVSLANTEYCLCSVLTELLGGIHNHLRCHRRRFCSTKLPAYNSLAE
jgi:sugar phosphate permease